MTSAPSPCPKRRGHEQLEERFSVVVQSDAFLPLSFVLIAAHPGEAARHLRGD